MPIKLATDISVVKGALLDIVPCKEGLRLGGVKVAEVLTVRIVGGFMVLSGSLLDFDVAVYNWSEAV